MKAMIKVENGNAISYMVENESTVEKLGQYIKDNFSGAKVEIYKNDLTFEQLPDEIKSEVKSILKAFNVAYVDYENGKFKASASIGITAHYAKDHYFCGVYKAEEIYTKEERKQNFIEEFGYCPAYMR